MTPQEYEHYVASVFEKEGFTTTVTPQTNDWGIDIIAVKGKARIAVQAKMYGTGRKVNRAMIMELHGSMAAHDCTHAVLATDGELLPDAEEVARKLNIGILYTNRDDDTANKQQKNSAPVKAGKYPTFDKAWQTYIMPLKGKTLRNSVGDNTIISVDWDGITRRTSQGNVSDIPLEGFQIAYSILMSKGQVSRVEINEQYAHRCSSGIFLVLSQLPFVEVISSPQTLKLK